MVEGNLCNQLIEQVIHIDAFLPQLSPGIGIKGEGFDALK